MSDAVLIAILAGAVTLVSLLVSTILVPMMTVETKRRLLAMEKTHAEAIQAVAILGHKINGALDKLEAAAEARGVMAEIARVAIAKLVAEELSRQMAGKADKP